MRKLFSVVLVGIITSTYSHSLLAEANISGSFQFNYIDQDFGNAATSGASNNNFHTDQKIDLQFSNKTDNGIEINMFQTFRSNAANGTSNVASDGNYVTLEGSFGYIGLGTSTGIGDELTPTAADLIGPGSTDGKAPQFYSSSGSLTSQQASLINIIDTEANLTYKLPSFGGLTIGASYKDAGSGASANNDETVVAGIYEFTSGNVEGSFAYASNSIDGATAGASGLDSSSIGITLSSGPITFIYADAEDDQSATIKTEVTDFGLSYNVNDSLVFAASNTEVRETSGGETLDIISISAKYEITSGLDAYITYHDYDYIAGSSGATSDDGSATMLTIEASF